ncbi:linoleoyl-CoA desaturase [Aquabacterium commune]|uniref:Linoleoyl-CoA desaturase n=1 Tax=Aquabacterium commune TaxID=70586 RepID=A0A4V3CWD7_9BURK|nr:linoleoyl-CoA desaturase [Aquabacterium commune]
MLVRPLTAETRQPGPSTPEALDAFARELDAIRDQAMAQRGAEDARYIVRLLWVIRGLEAVGRLVLLGAAICWAAGWAVAPAPWLAALVGTVLLGLSKCLQNMEFGHNVMHGQYEWMNDPRFEGKSHEWDSACAKEDWRDFHNHMHHHYTNVAGVDRDFGYGMLRLSADTPWEPRHLIQAPYAALVALLFEWAIAIHNLEFERLRTDRDATQARMQALWPRARAKMAMQLQRDFLAWPILAGTLGALAFVLRSGMGDMAVSSSDWGTAALAFGAPALVMLAGNALAGVIRNLWTFVVIFCGHFTDGVHLFPADAVATEHRGHWYLRQILGSSNLRGGWLFHVMTGNLSHQIEHHLFPDLPARRYAEVAPAVRAVCLRHGVPYNTGSLTWQFFTVVRRIVRHSLPGGEHLLTPLPRAG